MSTPKFMFLMANNTLSDSRGEQCDCACMGDMNRKKEIVLPMSSPSGKDENDCACSACSEIRERAFDLSPEFVDSSNLRFSEIDPQHFLVFNQLTGGGGAIVNAYGKGLIEDFHKKRQLLSSENLEIIVGLINAGLLDVKGKEAGDNLFAAPQIISAWIHLTDRCNLRCSYCYLPHIREDMSSETGRAAIDAIFRSAIANDFQQIKLKYAGGEPLLRFPLIEELHRYAQLLAREHDFKLEGVVLSNGTLLTAEMVGLLKSLGLRLMISMDGLGQYHDSHRPYAGGRGTFEDVAEAVNLALANGLVPNISITISSRTAEGLPEVVAWVLDRDLPFSLNFYRENDLSASHEDMQLDEEKIIRGMLAAFKVIEDNLPRHPFLGGIIDRANLTASHTHTCGVGQNYLVFDQNGQVAKCQMHIRKPVTDIHAVDPLALIRADTMGIQNLPVLEKEGCKTCEWKNWCTGGCPLATHRATGRYDVKSPNCNIYKALFPEALKLEGLRLLKYQDDPEVVVKMWKE